MGKSAFAPLLISRLAHEKLPVLYHDVGGGTLLQVDFSEAPFTFKLCDYSNYELRCWEVSAALCGPWRSKGSCRSVYPYQSFESVHPYQS